jgi:hypothetical protein
MPQLTSARIEEHFGSLPDPRRREGIYPLTNIVVIALCAVISSADDFVAIARWANVKKDWLAKFLDLSAGIPSHDRFNAILGAIKPAEFEKCLLSWITALHEITDGQVVAIRDFFSARLEDDLKRVPHRRHETHERGHGRQDDRYYYLAKLPEDFPLAEKWPGLKAIGMAIRITEHDDGRKSDDVRYYIVSRYTSGRLDRPAARVVRAWCAGGFARRGRRAARCRTIARVA